MLTILALEIFGKKHTPVNNNKTYRKQKSKIQDKFESIENYPELQDLIVLLPLLITAAPIIAMYILGEIYL